LRSRLRLRLRKTITKMIKNYFKTFIKIARQNKLFTFLSLFGISMTIMFVMLFSMTIEKITSGSGPEKDLKKILFTEQIKTTNKRGFTSISALAKNLCEQHLKNVKSADVISMYSSTMWEFIMNGKYQSKLVTKTDAEYWNVFDFKFLQGRPYTKDEVAKGENLSVITRSFKELLFGSDNNVLGKTVQYTTLSLVIIGVIEDPPVAMQNAIGDLFLPYTLFKDYNAPSLNTGGFDYTGGFKVAFKANSSTQLKPIRNEVHELIAKIDAADTSLTVFLSGPYTQLEKMMAGASGDGFSPENYSLGKSLLKYLMLTLAFLLLPAINLMALNFARIHERGEEIAIRKSFGAPNRILRGQFLFENMLMTIVGGIIGILLSYLVILLLGDSLTIGTFSRNNISLSFSFNYIVFVAALVSCLIFGLLSGYLPAVRLSRMKPAVYLKGGEL
jgi:putative ABC transport system permease protein